jgi:hypothetical protein
VFISVFIAVGVKYANVRLLLCIKSKRGRMFELWVPYLCRHEFMHSCHVHSVATERRQPYEESTKDRYYSVLCIYLRMLMATNPVG